MVVVSGSLSDVMRRRKGDFFEILRDRIKKITLIVYIFYRLNEFLKINLGNSETYLGDTRDLKHSCLNKKGRNLEITDESISAIVNSPPYSKALDYIRNDLPQLTILQFSTSLKELESKMIGNPNLKSYSPELLGEIMKRDRELELLPILCRESISILIKYGRQDEAIRAYRFFKDMKESLREMLRVLKPKAKCAIIVGNNHYDLEEETLEIKNDQILLTIAEDLGFVSQSIRYHGLQKTMSGLIRNESILILEKPSTRSPVDAS